MRAQSLSSHKTGGSLHNGRRKEPMRLIKNREVSEQLKNSIPNSLCTPAPSTGWQPWRKEKQWEGTWGRWRRGADKGRLRQELPYPTYPQHAEILQWLPNQQVSLNLALPHHPGLHPVTPPPHAYASGSQCLISTSLHFHTWDQFTACHIRTPAVWPPVECHGWSGAPELHWQDVRTPHSAFISHMTMDLKKSHFSVPNLNHW